MHGIRGGGRVSTEPRCGSLTARANQEPAMTPADHIVDRRDRHQAIEVLGEPLRLHQNGLTALRAPDIYERSIGRP